MAEEIKAWRNSFDHIFKTENEAIRDEVFLRLHSWLSPKKNYNVEQLANWIIDDRIMLVSFLNMMPPRID